MWRQSRFLHITDMDKFEISLHMSCGDNSDFSTSFVAFSLFCCKITPFLQFTLFCREICFVAIYAFLRGEKLSQKLCPWRKNDKYEVWIPVHFYNAVIKITKEWLYSPQEALFVFSHYSMVSLLTRRGISRYFYNAITRISNECLYSPHEGSTPLEVSRDALLSWLPSTSE